MKPVIITLIIFYFGELAGQNIIDLGDYSPFHSIEHNDTIDLATNTLYPAAVDMDLDCDEIPDITIRCFSTPLQNLPSARNIEIVNLAGNNLQILDAFTEGSIINLENVTWVNRNNFTILYFNVLSGPSCAGISPSQPVMVNEMYIVFRKLIDNEYRYGWIHYSSRCDPVASFYLHRIAFDEQICSISHTLDETNVLDFPVTPNPFTDRFTIKMKANIPAKLTWRIFNPQLQMVKEGPVLQNSSSLEIFQPNLPAGLYFLQILSDNKLLRTQIISKI